jgi:hypothetical protein
MRDNIVLSLIFIAALFILVNNFGTVVRYDSAKQDIQAKLSLLKNQEFAKEDHEAAKQGLEAIYERNHAIMRNNFYAACAIAVLTLVYAVLPRGAK